MKARGLSFLATAGVAVTSLVHCGGGNTDGAVANTTPTLTPPGQVFGDGGTSHDASVAYDKCKVPPDQSDAVRCTQPPAPPTSFSPVTKWSWTAPVPSNGLAGSINTPLVGNFTDDNGDGVVDLCDIPDVIVTVGGGPSNAEAKIYMLAGNDGHLEITFDGTVGPDVNPAFGDLDGDGVPEVVATDLAGHIVVYGNDGKVKWTGPDVGSYATNDAQQGEAIAIYDLDADGTPEIIAGFDVFDAKGKRRFSADETAFYGQFLCPAPIAADLDGDGKLEVIFGNRAYHSDGSLYWTIPGAPGQPQVANFDSDPDPEILIARSDGLLVLEHDGTTKFGPTQAMGGGGSVDCSAKPAAINDFDGDGVADVSTSTCSQYGVYGVTSTGLGLLWTAPIQDPSGLAASTGFDFLGAGAAQAIYGDENSLWVFDGKTGVVDLHTARSSATLIEYPVVADVDNDQSADIVVVSNSGFGSGTYTHTVDVYEDAQKRWIPTRRVWNQHAYHVTNVREDGTIPRVMGKNWQQLNTFRTNAQIQGNGDCAPPPANPH